MNIPSLDFGGSGEELVFLHANGYPPECYRPLLSRLAEKYHVTAMVQRPLWPESGPEDIDDWRPLTDDFLQFLDAHHAAPLVCVGHSMGGIALLRAALHEPERFKAIVLLDPVLFPPYLILAWNLFKSVNILHRFHPLVGEHSSVAANSTILRLFTGYRRKSVFRYMEDKSLRAYVEGIACSKEEGGYQLCYSAEWEIRIYLTGIWHDMNIWRGLPKLKGANFHRPWRGNGHLLGGYRKALLNGKQPGVRVEALEKSTHL